MVRTRRAGAADAPALACILLEARRAAGSAFPPPVHVDDEMLSHVLRDVLPKDEVWLAEADGAAAGLLALERVAPGPAEVPSRSPDVLGLLFVVPAAQGSGIGSALMRLAKARRPRGLDLWVYSTNTRAIAFHQRHGFRTVGGTSGRNEEGVPDLLMRWAPDGERAPRR